MTLSDLLTKNIGIRMVAIVLAVGIWIVTSAQRRESVQDRPFDVPIALVGAPRALIITSPIPDSVSVRLRGRESAVRSLSSQDLEVQLDISLATVGEIDVVVSPQSINVPPGLEVVSIDPSKITIRLEPRRQRIVPIRAYPVGEVPEGFQVAEMTLNPENALVSGPESLIREVTEVVTERIVLSGRVAPFRKPVGLVADHPLVRVETEGAQVTVVVIREAPDAETEDKDGDSGDA